MQGEIRTRYFLIDPMLRAFGWDIYNFARVKLEYSTWKSKRPVVVREEGVRYLFDLKKQVKTAKKVDYALLNPDGKPFAMIEAKRLNNLKIGQSRETQLVSKAKIQVFGYVARSEVKFAGLTDGNRWMLYRVIENSAETPEVESIMDISIMRNNLRKCVESLEMLQLSRLRNSSCALFRQYAPL